MCEWRWERNSRSCLVVLTYDIRLSHVLTGGRVRVFLQAFGAPAGNCHRPCCWTHWWCREKRKWSWKSGQRQLLPAAERNKCSHFHFWSIHNIAGVRNSAYLEARIIYSIHKNVLDYNLLNQDLTHWACITSWSLKHYNYLHRNIKMFANTVSRLSLSHAQRLSVSHESWLMLLAPGSSVPSDRATEKCRTGECDRRKDIRTQTADEHESEMGIIN